MSHGINTSEPARGADRLIIPFGTVVTANDGTLWVYVGTRINKSSLELWFVKEMAGGNNIPWTYNATMLDTLIKKFPSLQEFLSGCTEKPEIGITS